MVAETFINMVVACWIAVAPGQYTRDWQFEVDETPQACARYSATWGGMQTIQGKQVIVTVTCGNPGDYP